MGIKNMFVAAIMFNPYEIDRLQKEVAIVDKNVNFKAANIRVINRASTCRALVAFGAIALAIFATLTFTIPGDLTMLFGVASLKSIAIIIRWGSGLYKSANAIALAYDNAIKKK